MLTERPPRLAMAYPRSRSFSRPRNSRTLRQPFATLLESHRSKIRGKASLETHPFATAQNNSFRMTLLHKHQNNFRRDHRPGRIPSRRTLLESAHSGDNRFEKNQQKISRLESHPCTNAKITALESHSCKKRWGEGVWAHFSGHSLNQENLSGSEPNAPSSPLARRAASVGSGKHSLPRPEDMIMCSPI